MKHVAATLALAWLAVGPAGAAPADYPTEVLADYVFGCMATNGQTQEALRRCACSIDRVARALPYADYVRAETVLRMQTLQGGDPRAAPFRTMPIALQAVEKLRTAQIEAEKACFTGQR
jgi:hypothetical protein